MERGPILFEYTPLPMTPMTVAVLILVAIVTATAPVALPPEFFPLGGACFLPFLVVLVWALLQRPSPARVRANGMELSLPVWRRILRQPDYVAWVDVLNVYPAAYEISGAAMSPFASSAGTLVHTGLGLETVVGRSVVVRFTPGSIRRFRAESPGFTYAMEAVRQAFREIDRPLVSRVRAYTDDEVRSMHESARLPLVGMGQIVLAFFLPPTLVGGVVILLNALDVIPSAFGIGLVLAFAAIPPIASVRFTLAKSRRRNHLLRELAKHEEFVRARD